MGNRKMGSRSRAARRGEAREQRGRGAKWRKGPAIRRARCRGTQGPEARRPMRCWIDGGAAPLGGLRRVGWRLDARRDRGVRQDIQVEARRVAARVLVVPARGACAVHSTWGKTTGQRRTARERREERARCFGSGQGGSALRTPGGRTSPLSSWEPRSRPRWPPHRTTRAGRAPSAAGPPRSPSVSDTRAEDADTGGGRA